MSSPWFRLGRAQLATPEIREVGKRWLERYSVEPLGNKAEVCFAIPLISAARSRDWNMVQALLRRTIHSLVSQSCGDWHAIICSQDRPDAVDLDPRISFLPYDGNLREGQLSDKPPKFKKIIRSLIANRKRDGYVFTLDSDDIVHPGLVAHILKRANPGGYIITRGYQLNLSNMQIAYRGFNKSRFSGTRPFHLVCGSCAAFRLDVREDNRYWEVLRTLGRHKDHVHTMAAFGLYMTRIPFPGAIYCVNHGENLQLKRGQINSKISYIRKRQLPDSERIKILQEFGFQSFEELPVSN